MRTARLSFTFGIWLAIGMSLLVGCQHGRSSGPITGGAHAQQPYSAPSGSGTRGSPVFEGSGTR